MENPFAPVQPQGRFKRFWMDLEVELVDSDALRQFDLHALNDEDGNFLGVVDMDDNERIQWALTRVIMAAVEAAEPVTGVRYSISNGPHLRLLEDNDPEQYRTVWIPAQPVRRDDGTSGVG